MARSHRNRRLSYGPSKTLDWIMRDPDIPAAWLQALIDCNCKIVFPSTNARQSVPVYFRKMAKIFYWKADYTTSKVDILCGNKQFEIKSPRQLKTWGLRWMATANENGNDLETFVPTEPLSWEKMSEEEEMLENQENS